MTASRNFKGTYISKFCSPFLYHCLLFALSFIFGVLTVRFKFVFADNVQFSNLLSNTINNSFWDNFISFFIPNFALDVLISVCGFFTFGMVVDICAFTLIGLGNGALFAGVCNCCGWTGIAINLTLFLIPSVLMLFLHIIISTASLHFSNGLAVAVFTNRSLIGIKIRMNDLLKLFLLSIPCIAAVCALRALFILIFSGVFFA